MSKRTIIQMAILTALAMLAALIPLQVRAGGVCGGAYTVESGDTVEKLASMCGTTSAAIFSANSGLKEPLTVGQSIIIPGASYNVTATVITTVTPTVTPTGAVTYNTYNYYNYYNLPSSGYVTTYTVQAGDTFDGIAAQFGVPVYDLWMANLHIPDVQQLSAGQLIYIPAIYWTDIYPETVVTAVVSEPRDLTYMGQVPTNASRGTVALINNAKAEVYVSLRSNRADGTLAIHEYPVKGWATVDIPTGWIDYVAWVGGVKYTGGFQLNEDILRTITFQKNKVVID